MIKIKLIQEGFNKVGTRFIIAQEDDKTFGVWKESINYSNGRNTKSWRYIKKGLNLELATSIFNIKLKGKQL